MIPVVTSLAPVLKRTVDQSGDIGLLYQNECIESWQVAGFDVISVNAADEVERISALYPGIKIHVASRDERELFGKPLVPISELVKALKATGARNGGIINSDIMLRSGPEISTLVADLAPGSLLYLRRQEVSEPSSLAGYCYSFGFDGFFFDIEKAFLLDLDPFTLGIPWWDYYLPLCFILSGGKLLYLDQKLAFHIHHSANWNVDAWRRYHHIMRGRLEKRLIDSIMATGDRLTPSQLYAMSQGGYFFRHYSGESVGYNLGLSNHLTDTDVDNHIVAYGYFILDFIDKMSKRIMLDRPIPRKGGG